MKKTHVSEFLDVDNLERQISEGFISRKPHPTADLVILNYTAMAQYTGGKMLDNEVRHCRGLILDTDGYVVARPFAKFHNSIEHVQVTPEEQEDRKARGLPPRYAPPPLPTNETFEVYAKLDGSLGVLYPVDETHAMATRGSFMSEQSQWATRYYQEHYANAVVPEGQTYLFEIIYPQNRIVVKYEFEGLVLLAVIDNATGKDLPLPSAWPGPVVEKFDFDDFDAITAMSGKDPDGSSNQEGFVIRFASGVRTKVKFGEYIRLHRILTNTTTKTVYLHLGAKVLRDAGFDVKRVAYSLGIPNEEAESIMMLPDPMADLIDNVPDEFVDWLHETINKLQNAADEKVQQIEEVYASLQIDPTDRKGAALKIKSVPRDVADSGLMFARLQGQSYLDRVWKQIRPATERAFTVDADG